MASGPTPVGHRLWLLELVLAPLLVLLVSGLEPVLGQKVYTNTWAVHIPGGQAVADQIASKHGFINFGHVSYTLCFWTYAVLQCRDTVKSKCFPLIVYKLFNQADYANILRLPKRLHARWHTSCFCTGCALDLCIISILNVFRKLCF